MEHRYVTSNEFDAILNILGGNEFDAILNRPYLGGIALLNSLNTTSRGLGLPVIENLRAGSDSSLPFPKFV